MLRSRAQVRFLVCAGLVASFLAGCGGGLQGPRIRFSQASPQELASVQNEEVVWYEFRTGDTVPMVFALRGIVEADAPEPTMLRASRDFWIVTFKDGRQYFSFDGEHISQGDMGKYGIFLTSTERGGATGVMLFIGRREDMPPELR